MTQVRRLIPYAGRDAVDFHAVRNVPAERADELRRGGLSWKNIADELTLETSRPIPFTIDGIYAAVMRWRRRGGQS